MKFKFKLEKCAYIKPWERALSSLGFDNSLEVKRIIKLISKAFSASIVNLPAGEQVYGNKAHFRLSVIVYDPTFIHVSKILALQVNIVF